VSIRDQCPACGEQSEFCFEKKGYFIWRCNRCGSMFVNNVPDAQELVALYDKGEYYELDQDSVARIQNEGRRRIGLLSKFKTSGNYFEIGCAKGLQLDLAKGAGFKTFGIELSKENVEICREKGHEVICGFLEDIQFRVPSRGFDVISCLDVIEHVETPLDFLSLAASMLAENGVMVLSTPNYSGPVAKVLREKDPYLIPPEHLNFFTLAGMHHLFRQTGLREIMHTSFGTLTIAETGRVVSKYFPAAFKPLEPILLPIIPFGVGLLNLLKLGMEQEFYLCKKRG